MNVGEKSDNFVVPEKLSNQGVPPGKPAERAEGRKLAKGNSDQQTGNRTQGRGTLPSALERIRQAAKADKKLQFTSLWHHVYAIEALRDAFENLKKQATPGIDGVTWAQYEGELEKNLQDLSSRLRRGAYHAKPVKRAYIPKADGRLRPIGITALEDKLVQRAVVQVLEPIYETDFMGYSYGFRPGRGAHDALDALTVGITARKVNWVLEADIRSFFDMIHHEWLVKFLKHRIADKRIIRQIQKWLKAGVLEKGQVSIPERGTPQGGSISPLLANIYLHYAFDLWIQHWRKTQSRGDVVVVRYADDFVLGFQYGHEAVQCEKDLRQRLSQFGVELHPEKTRLIEFGRFAAQNRKRRGQKKPETFHFLGFTFINGKSRKGRYQIIRKTIRKRMRSKLKEIKEELRERLHDSIESVGRWLRRVLQGHYQYYGVPLNYKPINTFFREVVRQWFRSLKRRSQKRGITWEKMRRIVKEMLPTPRIVHPYPSERLSVKT